MGACYKCGGQGGNVAQLCPKCSAERRAELAALQENFGKRDKPKTSTASVSSDSRLDRTTVMTVGAVVFGLCAFYFALFSSYGPGLALSRATRVHNKCLAKMSSGMSKNPDKENPLGLAFAGAFTGAICDSLRDQCVKDPESGPCVMFDRM